MWRMEVWRNEVKLYEEKKWENYYKRLVKEKMTELEQQNKKELHVQRASLELLRGSFR